jgi:hypothetical protein
LDFTMAGKDIEIMKNILGLLIICLLILPRDGKAAPLATAIGADRQISLTWSNVADATGYQVEQATVPGGPYAVLAAGLPTNVYLHTGLVNGITNYYVVTASTPTGNVVFAEAFARPWVLVLMRAINCGGGDSGVFKADNAYTGGSAVTTTSAINRASVTDPAPEGVYQSARSGSAEYILAPFHPSRRYRLRFHFAEIVYATGGTRSFHLSLANAAGTYVDWITWIDIISKAGWAGAPNKAIIQTYDPFTPTTAGQIRILTRQTLPLINGIEVYAMDGPLPNASVYPRDGQVEFDFTAAIDAHTFTISRSSVSGGPYTVITQDMASLRYTDTNVVNGVTNYYIVKAASTWGETESAEFAVTPGVLAYAINVNGGNSGRFSAENSTFTRIGGTNANSTATLTTLPVARATIDPAEDLNLYRYYRIGPQTNIFAGLVPGAEYRVRLHCTEPAKTIAGTRVFHVDANGGRSLTNLDIFAEAGGKDKVLVKEFIVSADGSGIVSLSFVPVTDLPIISGIELRQQSGVMAPPPPTSLAASGQTDFIVLSWVIPVRSVGYTVLRSETSGGPYTVLATNMVVDSFVDSTVSNGVLYFYRVSGEANGVEVEASRSAEVYASAGFKTAVNAGGTATGRFAADSGFNTGSQRTAPAGAVIGTNGVPLAPPQGVLLSQRYANDFTWTYTGVSNHLYLVRLYFAEFSADGNAAGKRVFHIRQDGTNVFASVDVCALVGNSNALVREFYTTVNASSKIVVQCVRVGAGSAAAMLNGVEVIDTTAGSQGLYAQYYANYDEAGASEVLAFSEFVPAIDTNWNGGNIGSPAVGDRHAKVIWNGKIMLNRNSTYTFYAKAAGGFRMWVTNTVVINKWNESSPGEYVSGTLTWPTTGFQPIRVEYFNHAGNADAVLEWESKNAGITRSVVPSVAFQPVALGDPGKWVFRDVATPGLPGYGEPSTVPGRIGIWAAGSQGIANHQFACQKITGPFELTARAAYYGNESRYGGTWDERMGLVIRSTLTGTDGFAYGMVHDNANGTHSTRVMLNTNLAVSGTFLESNIMNGRTIPMYLRMRRDKVEGGYQINAAYSTNGIAWVTNAISSPVFPEHTVYAGMSLGITETVLLFGYFDTIDLRLLRLPGTVIMLR